MTDTLEVRGSFPVEDWWTIGQFKMLSDIFDRYYDEYTGIYVDGNFTFIILDNQIVEFIVYLKRYKGMLDDVLLNECCHDNDITQLLQRFNEKGVDDAISAFKEIIEALRIDKIESEREVE